MEIYIINLDIIYYMSSSVINTTLAKPILSADGFHNLVYSISGTTHTIFLDNSAIAINTNAGNIFSSYQTISNLFFGIAGDLSYGYTGNIDDVKVFNRALTATDVSAIYNANQVSGSETINGVLNNISTAGKAAMLNTGTTLKAGAYGLVKLNLLYTGPTIQLKAGLTGTPTDFYAQSAILYGTLQTLDGVSLITFLGGQTAYVTIWYDQTGNGNNATGAGTTLPIYNTSTNNIDFGTTGYFTLPNGAYPSGNSAYSFIFTPLNQPSSAPGQAIYTGGAFTDRQLLQGVIYYDGSIPYLNIWYANNARTPLTMTASVLNGVNIADIYNGTNGTTRTLYLNNSSVDYIQGQSGTRNSPSTGNFLGGTAAGQTSDIVKFTGSLKNFFWAPTALSLPDITALNIVYTPINILSPAAKTAMLYSGTRLQSGAFGVRLLISTYTGPVMQIKAGVSGTPTDFYAPKDGTTGVNVLTTSSGTTLAAFLSGTTAYVTIWYDQTGNSNHGVWVGSGSQPQPPPSNYFGGTVTLPTYPPTFNTTTNVIDFTNGGYFKLPDSSFPLGNTPYSYISKPTISGFSTSNPDYAIYRGGNWNGNTGNSCMGTIINRLPSLQNVFSNAWINNDYYTTTSFKNGQVIADTYIGNTVGTNGRASYYNGLINPTAYSAQNAGRSQTVENNYVGGPTGGGVAGQSYPNFNGTLPFFYWANVNLSQSDINILGNTPV